MKTFLLLILNLTILNAHAVSLPINEKIEADPLAPKNIFNLHTGKKEIVLTIDDGPTIGVTDKILDYLKEQKITATFFVIGKKAHENLPLIKRMQDEGHIIANHTYTHPILTSVVSSSPNWKKIINDEFLNTHQVLSPYIDNQRDWYFRAPGGAWRKEIADLLNQTVEGLKTIGPLYWDIGGELVIQNGAYLSSADWDCWRKNITVNNCLLGYANETKKFKGGVVLFHDVNVKSSELMIKYIDEMLKNGYRFISLDQVSL